MSMGFMNQLIIGGHHLVVQRFWSFSGSGGTISCKLSLDVLVQRERLTFLLSPAWRATIIFQATLARQQVFFLVWTLKFAEMTSVSRLKGGHPDPLALSLRFTCLAVLDVLSMALCGIGNQVQSNQLRPCFSNSAWKRGSDPDQLLRSNIKLSKNIKHWWKLLFFF